MSQRILTGCAILAAVFMVVGCGPTKQGLEARERAQNHFDLVRSRIDFDQAMQSFSRGEMIDAKRKLEVAIEKSPMEATYLVLLGRICLETSQMEAAAKSFEQAIRLDPNLPDPRYYLGILAERLEQPDEAAKRYLEAYELDQEMPQYLTAAAEVLVAEGRLAEAEGLLQQDSGRHENNAAMHHLAGKVSMLRGEWSRAVRSLDRAVLLDHEDQWLLEDLARAQLAAGHHSDCLETLVQLEPHVEGSADDMLELRRIKARCLVDARRWREAHKELYTLTTDHPSDTDAWIDLGMVCRQIGDTNRLRKAAHRIVSLDPRRFEGYFLLGCLAIKNQKIDTAINCFKRATELAPERSENWIVLGMMYEKSGQLPEAFGAYAKAKTPKGREMMVGVSDLMD